MSTARSSASKTPKTPKTPKRVPTTASSARSAKRGDDPRTTHLEGGVVHDLPADLRSAIASDDAATRVWADITPLARNEWICWVTSPKKAETRAHRIDVGIDKMRQGDRRPCCWPGCPHR